MTSDEVFDLAKELIVKYAAIALGEVTDRQLAESAGLGEEDTARLEEALSRATTVLDVQWNVNEQGEYVDVEQI